MPRSPPWRADQPSRRSHPPEPADPHPLQTRPRWAGDPRQLSLSVPQELNVRVRIVPVGLLFDCSLDLDGGVATLTLQGTLDDVAGPAFRQELTRAIAAGPKRLVLHLEKVQTMSAECARTFMFSQKNLDVSAEVYVVGANAAVKDALDDVGALDGATVQDTYEAASLAGAGAGR